MPDRARMRSERRGLVGLVAVLLAGACLAGRAGATPVLDQEVVPPPPPRQFHMPIGQSGATGFPIDAGQVFVVGITGSLTGIEVLVARRLTAQADLLVDVRTVAAGHVPQQDSGVLGSATVPKASVGTGYDWVSVPIGPVPVEAGDELAIVLQANYVSSVEQYRWLGSYDTTYAGTSHYRPGHTDGSWNGTGAATLTGDVGFRTYVEPVPEPATVALLAIGGVAAALVVRAGRTRRHAPRDGAPSMG